MSGRSPERAKKSESRKFDLAASLGRVEGLLDALQTRTREQQVLLNTLQTGSRDQHHETIHLLENVPPPSTMSAKNTLTFSGSVDESVSDLINDLEMLKIANNWTDNQLFGQAVCTLKGDAKRWFRQQDIATFTPTVAEAGNNVTKFNKLSDALKQKFAPDRQSGDIVFDVIDLKQKPGQSVDDYIAQVQRKFDLAPEDLSESLRVSLLISGFLPEIQDALQMRDITSVSEVQKYARRFEKLHCVQKHKSMFSVETEACMPSVNAAHMEPIIHKPPVRGPQTSHRDVRQKSGCWTCGGPHLQRDCRAYEGNRGPQARPWRGHARFRGRGRGRGRGGYRGRPFNSMSQGRQPLN